MGSDTFHRALAFEDAMRERCAISVEPWRFGTALFNSDRPLVYDLNYLRAHGDLSEVSAEDLIAEADPVMARHACVHRQIEMGDEATADQLAPGMAEAGYQRFRAVYMTLQREPERRPGLPDAEEITWDELRPTVVDQLRREPFATSEEVVQQLADRHEVEELATHLRDFGARVDGRIVSYCHLYSDGVIAQIEEVGTLEEFRNRGLASAVVLMAADVALSEGHELVFLVADEDDWPKALYARLGFGVVGRVSSFRKYPKP
jgi:ribosomal protein S18 acetylase RimI-like enzyme